MKKILFACSMSTFGLLCFAQQDYQLTHYMFDKLSFNPGYAGLNNAICATGIYRQQWAGFEGSPQTALFNVHAPIKLLRGGLGFTYLNDNLGFESNNIARLSYSYHLQNLGPGDLGIGASVGIIQKSLNANWITPDGTPWADDRSIVTNSGSDLVPDFNLGVYYKAPQFYAGLSVTHLGQFDMADLNLENVHHYWLTAGYNYDINPALRLRPSILVKSDLTSTQVDFNVNVLFRQMLWAGATYRIGDEIAPMIGYQTPVKKGTLRVGYSYGVTTSDIKGYSSGSHDIMLNYCFTIDKPDIIQKSKNPRFL